MRKTPPSLGRIAVMAAFALSCFGLLLFLWLAFGGPVPLKPKGYRITASFTEAAQLSTEADVRISGVPVGKVKRIEPDSATGRSLVELALDAEHAPLPADARAILRAKTLLGETYVELTPGTPGARPVPDGGRLRTAQVAETVELDEILRSFDKPTREAFRTWMQTQAEAIDGHGRDVNDALGNLGPLAEDASELVDVLNRQEGALRGLVANTGVVLEALTEREGQLGELIENADRVFATTAARDRELRETFAALPTFERESRRTLDRLAEFSVDTDPLVDRLRPAARELSPTLTEVARLAPDLEGFFRGLGPLIAASRTGFPAAERVLRDLRPLLGQLDPVGRQLNPILDWIAPYKSELTAFFANTVAATQATTSARGRQIHYLRTTNPLNPENLAAYPRRIGSNRTNPYTKPRHFDGLAEGLPGYEQRQCGRANPVATNDPRPSAGAPATAPFRWPDSLMADILRFGFPGGPTAVIAPPCRQQDRFERAGRGSQYPQVTPAP